MYNQNLGPAYKSGYLYFLKIQYYDLLTFLKLAGTFTGNF